MRLPVEVRWRPSGGRGEYEHVPSNVLLDRLVIVEVLSVPGATITTDVTGQIRSGKPRLRRANPHDRSTLNLPQLIAALALLPDPRRQDVGTITLPLREKSYLISSILLRADISHDGVALCIPDRLRILHYPGEVDLAVRLAKISSLFSENSDLVPQYAKQDVVRYQSLARAGQAAAELREVADRLIEWISVDSGASDFLDEPSEELSVGSDPTTILPVNYDEIGVDETRRRLRTHLKIDRSKKLRAAKIDSFVDEHGAVFCENCSFDFERKYGERGKGFMEVHHKMPLAGLLPNTVTRLEDLLLLCANCHRMVHRRRPHLTPEQLGELTRQEA